MIQKLSERFRGFFPVIIDMETTGLDAKACGVLELAAITLTLNEEGALVLGERYHSHVLPFEGALIDPKSSAIHQIDVSHPFRFAIHEKEALEQLWQFIREVKKTTGCQKAVLVGHNAWFDLSFLNAMIERTSIKRNPFHPFTSFDTATLSAVAYGQTVLAKACACARIPFDGTQAHSALYDAEITAQLFCAIVNTWEGLKQEKV